MEAVGSKRPFTTVRGIFEWCPEDSAALLSHDAHARNPIGGEQVLKTYERILARYGMVAVVIHFTIFFIVLGGFWVAIHMGWQPTGVAANAGTFTAAYLATKVTQPLRLGALVVLTPIVGKLVDRFRPARPGEPAPSPADPEPAVAAGVSSSSKPGTGS